ncbi:MAG: FkbM family methyltransferase [Anaerolineaceae bacterium]|nr:FkbM family methyltransferase [Anaerolineaceae bacterium]
MKFIDKVFHRLERCSLYSLSDKHINFETIGNDYGGFPIVTTTLSKESIVYSFGIGEDISFDVGLIEQFGCRIIGFDPTPKSYSWITKKKLPDNFSFHTFGLSDSNGIKKFYAPLNPSHISYSLKAENHSNSFINVEFRSLTSIMKSNGHTHIDVIKMDIEGSEYSVLPSILRKKVAVDQYCVEFHHRFKGFTFINTIKIILLFILKGYHMFIDIKKPHEIGFIKWNLIK